MGKPMEAVALFGRMVNQGIRPTSISFVGVLNACSHGGFVDLGFNIFRSMRNDYGFEPRVEQYGCIVDLLAGQEKCTRLMELKKKGVEKEQGSSSIAVDGEIHEFLLGDITHPRKEEIYAKLKEIDEKVRGEGYDPQVEDVLQDVGDREKEHALAIHSERLAICYGLISTEEGRSLRVVKNSRVCDDQARLKGEWPEDCDEGSE
ncbi:hypothetical protein SASPL_155416 [Salvia splendens]|uniref:DYW domain-containing protein n=1 Tax=Salvia splendens TaxID=180675 RepID=A0A8X8W1W3_SALSN|nr:hypothetical protein SASPL_155416 [Salvia splendens]